MKKIIFFSILIGSFFIIRELVQSTYSLWQKQDLLTSAQKQLERQKEENRQLKEELKAVQNQQFVEEQARDKLMLVKPGEERIILPLPSPTPIPVVTQTITPVSNLGQWEKLFLK